MKSGSADLKAFLAANRTCFRADLLTIVLPNAITVRTTTAPEDVTIGGTTWYAPDCDTYPMFRRGRYSQTCGLQVDTIDITLFGPLWADASGFNGDSTGQALGAAAINGYFDSAAITLDHVIMPTPGDYSLGKIAGAFTGKVSSAEPMGVNATLQCKSYLADLQQDLPRYTLQPQCGNQVYDTGCSLVRGTWTDAGTVLAQADGRTITTQTAAIIAKADYFYDLGVITFDSTGESVEIRWHGSSESGGTTTFLLNGPTLNTYSNGDTFTVAPGCEKSFTRCQFFSNEANFRGFRRVPKSEAAG